MTIQQTIGKAMKGGYPFYGEASLGSFEEISINDDRVRARFLDPIFWQSLGKAMGWEKENVYHFIGGTLCEHCERGKPEWQQVWRRFIDHLAEGGSPESFFNQL